MFASLKILPRSIVRSTSSLRAFSGAIIPQQLSSTRSTLLPRRDSIQRNTQFKFSTSAGNKDLPFNNIYELQANACVAYANNPVFGTRVGDKYEWMTYKEFGHQVQLFRNVLKLHNIGKNDKVAIISNNRVEWAVAMYAVASVGGQLVPMYEAQLEKDWKYIIKDSGAKMLLVGSEAAYEKTRHYIGQVGDVETVLCLDSSEDYLHSYKRWMQQAEKETPEPPLEVISQQDHLVLIYTSGTTGNPKGVTLSHGNVVHVLRSLQKLWADEVNNMEVHRSLAFLPWAHIFGQTTELHALLATGSSLGIVSKREQIVESIGLIKPTVILAVPMLFNKVYDEVHKKVSEGTKLRQGIVRSALKLSRRRNETLAKGLKPDFWTNFKWSLADKIVFAKIRERLGGNLRYMASGGAATSVPVLEFFEDIGIPICEGYGLTETAPVVTSSTIGYANRRLGCVGVALEGIDLRIINPATNEDMPLGEDGEICCSGPSVMIGYHNNPKADEEVFFYKDGKRFFRTGDLGRMVDGKFLKITGRIKEQFKLVNGKYVVPAPLEDHLTRSKFVAQAFLYGDNKPYTVTLLVPDLVELKAWAAKQSPPLPSDNVAALVSNPVVQDLLSQEVIDSSSVMKSFERPRKWTLLAEPFTPENHMLTPKMSLRRNNVLAAYGGLIDRMYQGTEGVTLPAPVRDSNDE